MKSYKNPANSMLSTVIHSWSQGVAGEVSVSRRFLGAFLTYGVS